MLGLSGGNRDVSTELVSKQSLGGLSLSIVPDPLIYCLGWHVQLFSDVIDSLDRKVRVLLKFAVQFILLRPRLAGALGLPFLDDLSSHEPCLLNFRLASFLEV